MGSLSVLLQSLAFDLREMRADEVPCDFDLVAFPMLQCHEVKAEGPADWAPVGSEDWERAAAKDLVVDFV